MDPDVISLLCTDERNFYQDQCRNQCRSTEKERQYAASLTKWVFQKLKLMKTHLTTLHIALINKMFLIGIYKAEHNNMKRE